MEYAKPPSKSTGQRPGKNSSFKKESASYPPSAASITQMAQFNPGSLTPAGVMQLQRTIGNQAVMQLLKSMMSAQPLQRQQNEAETLQRQAEDETVQRRANNTGMPDLLKAGVENLSGITMDNVRVYYNSDKPAQLQALAYTQGADIHVAPGQERHLPHEAWHVVQQAQGRVRPTMQLQGQGGLGVGVNDDAGLEREAEVMGERALGNGMRGELEGGSCPFGPPNNIVLQCHWLCDEKNEVYKWEELIDGRQWYISKANMAIKYLKYDIIIPNGDSKIKEYANKWKTYEEWIKIGLNLPDVRNASVINIETVDEIGEYDKKFTSKADYDSFTKKAWRSFEYNKEDPERSGNTTERFDIPHSTYKIPPVLFHDTHYTALDSIKNTGLDPNRVNSPTGLNLAGGGNNLRYRLRDQALKAVYLELTSNPAESMLSDDSKKRGGRVLLTIRVPQSFRDAHFRTGYVTTRDIKDDNEVGTTILSFALIPSKYIYINDPFLKKEKCLKTYDSNYDWSRLGSKPTEGMLLPMKEVREQEIERQKRRAVLAEQNATLIPPVTASSSTKEEKTAITISKRLSDHIDKFKQQGNNSDEDSAEWQ